MFSQIHEIDTNKGQSVFCDINLQFMFCLSRYSAQCNMLYWPGYYINRQYHGWPSTQPGTCTQPCPIVHTAVPPLFTQPCRGRTMSTAVCITLQGCVQAARLCRGSPVSILMILSWCWWDLVTSANQIAQNGSCDRSRIHNHDLGGTGVWPGKK